MVKLVVTEPESSALVEFLRSRSDRVSSAVALAEVGNRRHGIDRGGCSCAHGSDDATRMKSGRKVALDCFGQHVGAEGKFIVDSDLAHEVLSDADGLGSGRVGADEIALDGIAVRAVADGDPDLAAEDIAGGGAGGACQAADCGV